MCTAGENVHWLSHFGKQDGGSSKHYKYNYHMIQQSHFCMYPGKMKWLSWRDICTGTFILTLNMQSKNLSFPHMWLLGSFLYRSSLVIVYHFNQPFGSNFRFLLLLWATDHSFISLEWVPYAATAPSYCFIPKRGIEPLILCSTAETRLLLQINLYQAPQGIPYWSIQWSFHATNLITWKLSKYARKAHRTDLI